jgi:hypothetical protein
MQRVFTVLGAVVIGVGLLTAAPADASQIYFNDFDSAATVAGGIGATLSGITTPATDGGFSGIGTGSGNVLWNTSGGNPAGATTLTLTGLPSISTVDINFLLYAIDSWDSTNGSPAPDYFRVYADGNLILSATFANASGNVNDGAGGTHLATFVARRRMKRRNQD